MSRIKVDRITDRAGTGEPLFPNGVKVVGLTSLSNVVAGIATFENVSIGGTLTYDDVTNVDSTGIVTARGGFKAGDPSGIGATIDPNGNASFAGTLKVGTAITASNGIVTATSYRGDGSQLTGIDPAPQITGTASGAIAADKPVVVNANGTVSQVVQTIEPSTTTKVDTELSSNGTYRTQDVAWINDDKFIILARKMNDSNKVRYIFGSVDANGAITLGTPYGLITGDPTDCWNPKVAVDSSTGKIMVVIYDDNSNVVVLRGGVVNGAGNDIDWGADYTISGGNGKRSCAIASDNNGGFMVAYRGSNDRMHFRHAELDASNAVTVSNNVDWEYYNTNNGNYAAGENRSCMEYIPSVGAYWFVTEDGNRFYYSPNGIWLVQPGGYLRAAWAKSNGTGSAPTMTQATQTPFTGPSANTDPGAAGQLGYEPNVKYDSVTGKGILSYRRAFGGGKPMGAVLTFTDTSAQPTYTAAVELTQTGTEGLKQAWSSLMKEAVFYIAESGNTLIKSFTISGNTLVDANHTVNVFAGVDYQYLDVAANPTKGRVVTATQDEGNGDFMSASIVDIPFTSTNVTAENFIGFAAANCADTATATIKIVGNTSTQTGLTPGQKYYVTNTGTLSLTADTPSVEAGTAISATKIIVKG